MIYIRTKEEIKAYNESCDLSYVYQSIGGIEIADTIEELLDEIVFIEKGREHNVVYLPTAKARLDEDRYSGNYDSRLIGRIKVGLDKKAVAEWKELTEGRYKGCYDWVLL